MILYESEIEQISLELLRDENGYVILYGPDLLEGTSPERGYSEVVLKNRLRAAIDRINPCIPEEAREEAYKKALRTQALTVIDNNEAFHHLLTEGVDVKFSVGDGKSRTDKVWLVDFAVPENNVNKRPDIVLFINGLPLVVIELKNAADEKADVHAEVIEVEGTLWRHDPKAGFSHFYRWALRDAAV